MSKIKDMVALIKKSQSILSIDNSVDSLYKQISGFIDEARINVQRSINSKITKAYWCIGKRIVEEEQGGVLRAEYGRSILSNVAIKLQK